MKTIHRNIVGALIFSNDGHVLLGKNRSGGAYDGFWTIPGGGIEEGETPVEAIKREVKEEVGLDIDEAIIELISDSETGETEKTDRTTGETMLVKMIFIDYQVYFDQPASEITPQPGDDMIVARWLALEELPDLTLAPGVENSLTTLGFL